MGCGTWSRSVSPTRAARPQRGDRSTLERNDDHAGQLFPSETGTVASGACPRCRSECPRPSSSPAPRSAAAASSGPMWPEMPKRAFRCPARDSQEGQINTLTTDPNFIENGCARLGYRRKSEGDPLDPPGRPTHGYAPRALPRIMNPSSPAWPPKAWSVDRVPARHCGQTSCSGATATSTPARNGCRLKSPWQAIASSNKALRRTFALRHPVLTQPGPVPWKEKGGNRMPGIAWPQASLFISH